MRIDFHITWYLQIYLSSSSYNTLNSKTGVTTFKYNNINIKKNIFWMQNSSLFNYYYECLHYDSSYMKCNLIFQGKLKIIKARHLVRSDFVIFFFLLPFIIKWYNLTFNVLFWHIYAEIGYFTWNLLLLNTKVQLDSQNYQLLLCGMISYNMGDDGI